ncbi:PAS domain-containing protein [Ponticoccus alexandrii]|uniref:PAS domain-containing protein n=1 Tax=Ponticoccus alexandrii TaxID=1943633 RepID=A0ABX7F9J3_9RHOB|nr:PAS domain-containing protein [Ponticoccus alexandrii]KID12554.1 diguanylate cyclase [Rhodobacteraceae bacterium PD-2]QRF66526.1 PAS domain-containing protein [Ponticoccus alexandrii]
MLGKGGNDHGIVSMTEREKMRRLAPLRQVEAYWHGLSAGDRVPLRSQIDPRGMEDALEYAFLMERIAPTMAKVRVAGSHLNNLIGMQIAGMPLSSLIAPSERERFGQAVQHLFGDPAIVHLTLTAEDGFGKPDMEANMVLLPLRSDFGDLSRALGALITHGRIGRTPRRFLITGIEVLPVMGQGAAVSAPVGTDVAKPAPAFREEGTPFRHRDPAAMETKSFAPRRDHLRLVVDNDD